LNAKGNPGETLTDPSGRIAGVTSPRRILDLARPELIALAGRELDGAVRAAEGRTMVAEVFAAAPGLVDGVHNAELMACHGADLIVLNLIDGAWSGSGAWSFPWLPEVSDLRSFAGAVGRPVAVNLEPDPTGDMIPPPRRANPDNARALVDAGAAGIVLTANPGTGASYANLVDATRSLREALGPEASLWVGKMHHAGRPEAATPQNLLPLAAAGASGVLVPTPGTVPGVTREIAAESTRALQEAGVLVIGTIGTSQEAAPVAAAVTMALAAKEVGFDAHHVGDGGYFGVGAPELLHQYSLTVRGRRHTWRRMALGARPA